MCLKHCFDSFFCQIKSNFFQNRNESQANFFRTKTYQSDPDPKSDRVQKGPQHRQRTCGILFSSSAWTAIFLWELKTLQNCKTCAKLLSRIIMRSLIFMPICGIVYLRSFASLKMVLYRTLPSQAIAVKGPEIFDSLGFQVVLIQRSQ